MNLDFFCKPLVFDTPNILFWGCLHSGHTKSFLWGGRNFKSSEEHDQKIVENWNSVADEETIGFLLGDNMFGYGGLDRFEKLMGSLEFSGLYIQPGNHYAGYHQMLSDATMFEDQPIYVLGDGRKVNLLPNITNISVKGTKTRKKANIVLSHYPILSWDGQGTNSYHLHSHCHNNLRNSPIGKMYEETFNVLEVSVERSIEINDSKPFSLSDVQKYMGNQPGGSPDHHTSQTKNAF